MTRLTQISKFLCKFLRHSPETLGITLDSRGWVRVCDLLAACDSYGFSISLEELEQTVESDDKQRFTLREGKIRANQGHSILVDLGLIPLQPPKVLYHGTAKRFLDSILTEGLTKQKRHHVHLTESIEIAESVGARYGEPVVLEVSAVNMYIDNYDFYLTANNVWLTDNVPVEYISRT